MASLLYDLRTFLMANGYENVFVLEYPPEPAEMISLHERENPRAFGTRGVNYGIRAAPVQLRIRRENPQEAEGAAKALFSLLDSGPGELRIELVSGRNVTSRPIPPFFLEQDERGRWIWVLKTTILTSGL